MEIGLVVAGALCFLLGVGHETIGSVWVLPSLTDEVVPQTPFGSRSMTVSMIRVTWHIVTIFVLALGTLLMTLGWADIADPKGLLLRWFSVMWLVAAAMAFASAGRRVRSLRRMLRLPVPFIWVVIAALCWIAST